MNTKLAKRVQRAKLETDGLLCGQNRYPRMKSAFSFSLEERRWISPVNADKPLRDVVSLFLAVCIDITSTSTVSAVCDKRIRFFDPHIVIKSVRKAKILRETRSRG